MLAFVLLWTVELYAVQSATLVYPNETGERFAMWAPKIRFVLDLLFISTLTVLLRRRWLIISVIASFFIYLTLLTYFHYFLKPLSILTVWNNWSEGLRAGSLGLDVFPKRAILSLFAMLAIKLALLVITRRSALPRKGAWVLGTALACAYAALMVATNRVDPLEAIQTSHGVGRAGEIRGYLGPWFAEWYYLGNQEVLKRVIELRQQKFDRLTPIEADVPIQKRLVIIQAESFDTNIIDYKVNGVEVTPFMNALKRKSMYYRVTTMHTNGSSDADFVTLNGVPGSKHVNTFILNDYPYENTTPEILKGCGYKTSSFHGNTGDFYNRRIAYEKIGFDDLYFQEEMVGRYGLFTDRWGVRDDDVFTLSKLKLREEVDQPTCHFIITLTTHMPYTLLEPKDWTIYPDPRTTTQHFINNMRYLDRCMQEYFAVLPADTTVVVYADHPTEEGDGDFKADRVGGKQYIPWFLYDTSHDLAKLQRTRGKAIATDGSLNLADMSNYLRGQIARSCGQEAKTPAADKATDAHSEQ